MNDYWRQETFEGLEAIAMQAETCRICRPLHAVAN
ncbi:hypothetical protein STPYR_12262 [uncultured Stenotrophomonas sp.]|uniref:Uncharacterized protein n=1 Tax=uncultured Stenotrophomonas sp. TaxID=165438 RepID=A0A1Y5Q4V9_9GAMM|nr:hypothetical protein STPYR_12262 [uncultured Stenotrophomonas sp.]